MTDKEFRIDDPDRVMRLAVALAHELRVDVILAIANEGPASATMLARRGLLPSLQVASYHLVKLAGLGVLGRVDSRQRRGAMEYIYGITDFGREVLKTAIVFGRKRR